VSYSRFSNPEQAAGDSEDRQADMFRGFCERHNLTPLAEVFADRGRSGYKDEHRKKGKLGQLIQMAKDGRFEPGTVIVVEAWDRLGRLRPDDMTALVSELVKTGVAVGVCRLDDIFTEADFGSHKWTTLAVFIQLAFQESKQKGERVAASWARRRKGVREGKAGVRLNTRVPAWLERPPGGGFRVIRQRAAAVKRIFELAAAGHGYGRIAKRLTAEKVPAFGEVVVRQNRHRSQFSGRWSRAYIALILNDRRALGELQPCTTDGKADGPPLPSYFPAVVSADEYLLARNGQAERLGRDKAGRVRVWRQGKHVNAFQGLLRHARDGEGFELHNKRTGDNPHLTLVAAAGAGGRGVGYSFPYGVFEAAVLGRLKELDPAEVLPRRREAADRLALLRAELADVRADLETLKADVERKYSKALADVLRRREDRELQLAAELQEELAKTILPTERAWGELPSLVNLVRDGGDDARLRLRVVLRRVVESIWVLTVRKGHLRLCAAQVHFVGGECRNYLVVHKPAGNRRKHSWSCRSFKEVGVKGALDLRRREHATRLTRFLEGVSLPAD
jgi:DNA invertase Pin-like site-specific DNA recombinase